MGAGAVADNAPERPRDLLPIAPAAASVDRSHRLPYPDHWSPGTAPDNRSPPSPPDRTADPDRNCDWLRRRNGPPPAPTARTPAHPVRDARPARYPRLRRSRDRAAGRPRTP